MSSVEPVVYSIACDWITGVALEENESMKLHSLATSLFRTEQDFGNTPHGWGMAGFKGWRCGQVQLGQRDKEFICRLSSDCAARNWKRVVESCTNVSRFDIQATVRFDDGPTREIHRVRRAALRHSKKHDNKPIVRWIMDSRGGYTLYLGARESNVFARVYDKFAQSHVDHFKDCVRYELQFNYHLARLVAHQLYPRRSPIPDFACHLRQFFEARDIRLELPGDDGLTFCFPRKATDDDRKLLWLSESVRPSVLALIARGRGEEVLRALGLVQGEDDYVVHVDQSTLN